MSCNLRGEHLICEDDIDFGSCRSCDGTTRITVCLSGKSTKVGNKTIGYLDGIRSNEICCVNSIRGGNVCCSNISSCYSVNDVQVRCVNSIGGGEVCCSDVSSGYGINNINIRCVDGIGGSEICGRDIRCCY